MTNDHLINILKHPFVSVLPMAKIMNPDRPSRVHNQLRTSSPTFTEDEIKRLVTSDEWKALVGLMQAEIPWRAV